MTEPTTSMTFATMYGRLVSRHGCATADAKAYVNDAYIRFLRYRNWSFLNPVATLTLTANTATSALPDNFVYLVEDFIHPANVSVVFEPRSTTDRILQLYRECQTTGDPYLFAIEPAAAAATGQRWNVRWYPTPSTARVLTYRYHAVPAALSADGDYPVGGPFHAWTILAMAYQEWEQDKGSAVGLYAKQAEQALAESVRIDEQVASGVVLGEISTGRKTPVDVVNTNLVTFA